MKRFFLSVAALLCCGAAADACPTAGAFYRQRAAFAPTYCPPVQTYAAPTYCPPVQTYAIPAPVYAPPPVTYSVPMAYAPAPCPPPVQTYAAPAPVYAPPACDYGAAPAYAPAYAFSPSYGVGYGTVAYRQRVFLDAGFFRRVHSHVLFLHHSGGLHVAAPGVRVRIGR